MKNLFKLTAFAVITILLYQCTGTRNGMLVQGKDPFKPWNYQLWIQRNDLEYIGTVTDSIRFTNYLGIPFLSSNKDFRVTKRISYPGSGIEIGNPYLSRVLYYMHEQKPDADIIIPTKILTKRHRLFLGSRRSITVVGKAYKIK